MRNQNKQLIFFLVSTLAFSVGWLFIKPAFEYVQLVRQEATEKQENLHVLEKRKKNIESQVAQMGQNPDQVEIVDRYVPQGIKEEQIIQDVLDQARVSGLGLVSIDLKEIEIKDKKKEEAKAPREPVTDPTGELSVIDGPPPEPKQTTVSATVFLVGSFQSIRQFLVEELPQIGFYHELAGFDLKRGKIDQEEAQQVLELTANILFFSAPPYETRGSSTVPAFEESQADFTVAEKIQNLVGGSNSDVQVRPGPVRQNPFIPIQ